jgi:hypothetical protein
MLRKWLSVTPESEADDSPENELNIGDTQQPAAAMETTTTARTRAPRRRKAAARRAKTEAAPKPRRIAVHGTSSISDGGTEQLATDRRDAQSSLRKRARTSRGKSTSDATRKTRDTNDDARQPSDAHSKRTRSKFAHLKPSETAALVADMQYDSVQDVTFERHTRMMDESDTPAVERVVVDGADPTPSDDADQATARIMCTETSADHPACKRPLTSQWIKSAKRHINGTLSQARSVRANPGTPEKVFRKLSQLERDDAAAGTGVPRAAVLPPHVERDRRASERAAALERDVAAGDEAELPEFRSVSERYAIGFMKHLEVGQNIDIAPNGKYTFMTTESALPEEAVEVLDAAKRASQTLSGIDAGSAPASRDGDMHDEGGGKDCADDQRAGDDAAKNAQPVRFSSENNVPLMAQRSHETSRRDANNTFQRALRDSSEPLASSDSMYERLMNFDPRSTAGIARESPLMRPFSRVLSFTPQPYLFSAATDDARAEMYSSTDERPAVHAESVHGSSRVRDYDNSNPRDVEREVLSAFSHKDFYPIVPRISFELEQSFLREPFVGEPACISGDECAGMTDLREEIPPMTLVAFYPLSEIVETFIASHRAARDEFLSGSVRNEAVATEFDQARRAENAAVKRDSVALAARTGGSGAGAAHAPTQTRSTTLKTSKCVLCHRAFALKLAMHLNALNATTPKDYAFVQYCNITDTHGEYDISACVFNSNARYVGLPGPIALHNSHLYRRITVRAHGQTVSGLEQLHQRVGMDTTVHF